jgi:hypothetical protein
MAVNSKVLKLLCTSLVLSLVSCAQRGLVTRGKVVMKISGEESHVNLGDGVVREGDKVAILREECPESLVGKNIPAVKATHCQTVKRGEGMVTRVLNDKYSIISTQGVSIREGDIVELNESAPSASSDE